MKLKETTVTKRTVRITHSQSMKQSQNYQTSEAHYGISMDVGDSSEEIKAGLRRAEKIVEEALAVKLGQQRTFLSKLAP